MCTPPGAKPTLERNRLNFWNGAVETVVRPVCGAKWPRVSENGRVLRNLRLPGPGRAATVWKSGIERLKRSYRTLSFFGLRPKSCPDGETTPLRALGRRKGVRFFSLLTKYTMRRISNLSKGTGSKKDYNYTHIGWMVACTPGRSRNGAERSWRNSTAWTARGRRVVATPTFAQ